MSRESLHVKTGRNEDDRAAVLQVVLSRRMLGHVTPFPRSINLYHLSNIAIDLRALAVFHTIAGASELLS
jgi:hypothetical protein